MGRWQLRLALANFLSYGLEAEKKRENIKKLLKLSDEELWRKFDEHQKTCPICR